jgi:uncharacterized protein
MRSREVTGLAALAIVIAGVTWALSGLTPAAHHHSEMAGMVHHLDLIGFLTLGLVGGFAHCVGMCSPFVLFVSRRYAPPEGTHSALSSHAWYSGGRIITYAALGAIAGAMGRVVETAGAWFGLQRTAAALAGAVLIVWALASLLDIRAWYQARGMSFIPIRGLAGKRARRMMGHPLTFGLFLGLLPCGLLYSALVGAVARGGAVDGAVALAMFGLGTAPALFGVSLADDRLARHRFLMNRLSQVFVLAMGVWFLWTGLSR